MISMADGTQLAYIKETAWGVTPTTPAWQILRLTGESFNITRDTVTSSELTPTRDITDQVHVSGGASGGFDFELSYGAFDDIIASLLHSEWISDIISNGVKQTSLSFEKRFITGDATHSYMRYAGMVADTMSLSLEANAIATGSFGFMGKGGTVTDAKLTGATYNEATEERVISGSSHIASLSFGSFSSPKILSLGLEISNNLMAANVLGSLDHASIGAGQFNVSGSVEMYFEDSAVYNAFLSATDMALNITIGTSTAKKYNISLPRVRFSTGEVLATGANSYIMNSMTFQALRDDTTNNTMTITRKVA